MQVQMREMFMSHGPGTITSVNANRGCVSVEWESGRKDPWLYVGGSGMFYLETIPDDGNPLKLFGKSGSSPSKSVAGSKETTQADPVIAADGFTYERSKIEVHSNPSPYHDNDQLNCLIPSWSRFTNNFSLLSGMDSPAAEGWTGGSLASHRRGVNAFKTHSQTPSES